MASTGILHMTLVDDGTKQTQQSSEMNKTTIEFPGFISNKFKTAMCENFVQGKCQYGQKCNFAHGEEELRRFAGKKNSNYKTVVCRSWKAGSCQFGEKCRFAHGECDMLARKNTHSPSSPMILMQQSPRIRPKLNIQTNYDDVRYAQDVHLENKALKLENTRLKAQIEILLKVRGADLVNQYDPRHSTEKDSYFVGEDDYDSKRYERLIRRRG